MHEHSSRGSKTDNWASGRVSIPIETYSQDRCAHHALPCPLVLQSPNARKLIEDGRSLTFVMTVCPPWLFTKSETGPDGALSRVLPPAIARVMWPCMEVKLNGAYL